MGKYDGVDWQVKITGIGSPAYNVKNGDNYIARVLSVNARNDAHLIKAAPNMYEALEDIINQAEATHMMLPPDLADSILVFGKQALAKADNKPHA